jgi:heat-inducible transcriptional repressor
MVRHRAADPNAPLDARGAEVLRLVIRAYIHSGEPVGSVRLSHEPGLGLSPATIRTIMADLETRGFLAQPHPSAGRVPTDSAYRFYVDHAVRRRPVGAAEAQKIDAALARRRGELVELLEEASRQLSQFSQHVGVVLAPGVRRIVVERVEFVRLEAARILAIVVGRGGVVQHRILRTDTDIGQLELDRMGRFLSERFGGWTLTAMRDELVRRLAEERAACDRMVARSFEFGCRSVEFGEELEGTLFVEGASNLLGRPEFSDPEQVRSLLRTLEEKHRLVELLSRLLEARGPKVVIGEEDPLTALADCSVIASTYGSEDRVLGTVGIVGPRRMEYSRAIALVDYLASVLTRLLSDSELGGPRRWR